MSDDALMMGVGVGVDGLVRPQGDDAKVSGSNPRRMTTLRLIDLPNVFLVKITNPVPPPQLLVEEIREPVQAFLQPRPVERV